MSRAGSSGGGRSSLGYLFEPEEMFPIHAIKLSNQETTKKPSENSSALQDDKVIGDEADQDAPPKREEDSNPIVSHRAASIIYHSNHSGNNAGLLITDRPSTRVRCAPGGASSLGFLFSSETNVTENK